MIIIFVILISAVLGIMDKVKHHWESTWFSTIKTPKLLADWLNPHVFMFRDIKPAWFAWCFRYPLAGIGDFWHFMKGVLLQLIWISMWMGYHEATLLVWLVMCNVIYMVIFELFFIAMFNKK